ncbi:helix-turn-helix domain-containing protein [Nocardiopsis tropica]|uniref:Helix-turn-helix domain-containing protein n=1 Tax=Nocardiopsis tropica TaxID=109330 RepID=A0ABU7KSJ8_9ACTN|nr:helix-turn-helix domain-containing protein [Nocardiopsis umidischolae]MEE2052273.1 helix-turn-helix domain-containing protein [Nocardiopsis umidischolae]
MAVDDQLDKDEQRRTDMAVTVGVGVGQADTCEQPAPQDARAQLGDRLDAARLKARLSKSQLAARAALSRTTVTAALNNTGAIPSKETVTALARALGLDNASLLALRERASGGKPVSGRRAGQDPAPGPSVVHTVQGDVSGTVIMAGGEVTLTSHPRPEHTPIADHAVGVDHLSPAQLQVHAAVLPAPDPGGYPFLTPYLPRPHDARLCESLEPALGGETSVLVMLTGGSSTGKTRALYEALHALAPRRRLLRPATANDLLRLLADAQVDDQVVLWLNEAQRFFYGTSAAEAAAALHQLLHQRTGIVAVGTLWTSPYWEELTRFGTSADPHAQVRELLTDPATTHIPVPGHLSTHEQDQWEELATARGDRRMRDALHAGTADRGRVVQHLSGGPALLAAYDQGPGHTFTAVEHALLTAAIDARRLGHRAPLPAALLAQAADADLDPRERPADPDWAQKALAALCTGRRPGGGRTDIRHTLTALHPHVSRAGVEAGYEPADYLDQHLRRRRADQLGSPALWQALLDHAQDPENLNSLAQAAENRGLFQHAVRLYRKAFLAHRTSTPWHLLLFLFSSTRTGLRGDHWVAERVDLASPKTVARLLKELRLKTPGHACVTLLNRNPAAHTDLTDPHGVADLLHELHLAGQGQAVTTLANRAATHTDLADPCGIAYLIRRLHLAGQKQAVTTLANRAATHTDLADPCGIAYLIRRLHLAGQKQAVTTLANRAATHTDLTDPSGITQLIAALFLADQGQALATLLKRNPGAHVDLTHPGSIAQLLQKLRLAGQEHAITTLANRAAKHSNLAIPIDVAQLLGELHKANELQAVKTLFDRLGNTDQIDFAEVLRALRTSGYQQVISALTIYVYNHTLHNPPSRISDLLREFYLADQEQAVKTLSSQVASYISLTNPYEVTHLLRVLRKTRQEQILATVLSRDPVSHTDLTHPDGIARLLEELHEAGQEQAVTTLANRAATHTDLTHPDGIARLLEELHEAGQEQAVTTLANRAATHTDLTHPDGIARLLEELHLLGQEQALATVLGRNPAHQADPTDLGGIAPLLGVLRRIGQEQAASMWELRVLNAGGLPALVVRSRMPYGRELDGSPAQPWSWDELDL